MTKSERTIAREAMREALRRIDECRSSAEDLARWMRATIEPVPEWRRQYLKAAARCALRGGQ